MSALGTGAGSGLMSVLGWTLLHFIWQGALVALLLWCGLALMRGVSPRVRYGICCAALGLMVVSPAATFVHLGGLGALRSGGTLLVAPWVVDVQVGAAGGAGEPWSVRLGEALDWAAPLLPWLWMLGVVFCAGRLALGLVAAQRMRRIGVRAADAEIRQIFLRVVERLRVGCVVRLLESTRVEVPTVVGWLRPAVLLPLGCFAGLSMAQVEALLAHELAHIRRHDYLVSVLQGVVESLLFYHPAVWWVSRQVRRERECCCDEIAAECCADRLEYARALSWLEGARQAESAVALGANGGVLTMRIKRVLGVRDASVASQVGAVAVLCAVLLFCGITFARASTRDASGAPGTPMSSTKPSGQGQVAGELETFNSSLLATLKDKGKPDLSCTYYDNGNANHPGTCTGDVEHPACTDNENTSLSQTQIGCRWKIQRLHDWERRQQADHAPGAEQVGVAQSALPAHELAGRNVREVNYRGLNSVSVAEVRARFEADGITVGVERRYDPVEVAKAASVLKQMVAEKGRRSATVVPVIRTIAPDAVGVTFEVREGPGVANATMAGPAHSSAVTAAPFEERPEQGSSPGPPRVPDGQPGPATAPVRVSGAVAAGSVVKQVPPVYPPDAKANGVQGTVVLRAVIGADGAVKDLQVVSGPEELQASALDAVKQWKYKPYLLNGRPMEVETTIQVNYTLGGERAGVASPAEERYANATPKAIGGGVSPPALISEVEPDSRAEADSKDPGASGVVVVNFWVTPEGIPIHVRVVRGAGGGLDEKAVELVKQYRFRPATEDGKPVLVAVNVEVNFQQHGMAQNANALKVSARVIAGNAVKQVPPVYPPDAKVNGVQGTVGLRAVISKEGLVQNLTVLSGPEELRESALDAVRQWTYKPYLLNGEPVEVETTINVNYTLAK